MHKRHLHHTLRLLRHIRYGYLLAAIGISGAVFVFAARQNNLHALKLRDTLLQVDKDNGDVEGALRNLREYTYSHMNASLDGGPNAIYPPIQLKYRYERLVAAEKQRVEAVNSKIYIDAQNYCEQAIPSGRVINRVPCIQDYVNSHGALQAQPVQDALYKFDFVSPRWSPDLAGWSLVTTVVLAFGLILRAAFEVYLRLSLRRRF